MVYHVQTEDKGADNPVIETLIYRGGEILASHRSSYAEVAAQGADEKTIAEKIEAQHNEMIANIRAGRYDTKQRRPFGEGIISRKSFDEVVLDYLMSLTAETQIALAVLKTCRFVEGDTAQIDLQVSRMASGEAVAGAQVKIKFVSTVDKSRTLVRGETGEEGRTSLACSLPVLSKGTAALIIQASAGAESAEIKLPIEKPEHRATG